MPIKKHQVKEADFVTANDFSGNASDVIGGDGIARAATFESLETSDFVDPLNSSGIHPNWTQNPNTGTVSEDGTKLTSYHAGGSTISWWDPDYNTPNVEIDVEPYDFDMMVHVSNIAADNNAGMVVLRLDGDNTKFIRLDIRYTSSEYRVYISNNNDGGSVSFATVGQDNCWLIILRRGSSVTVGYSLNDVESKPSANDFTVLTTFDHVDLFSLLKNKLLLGGATWSAGTAPGFTIHYRKFSIKYETVSTKLRGYIGQGFDFHDTLNSGGIDNRWTKDIVDVADPDPTIEEDSTKLAIGRNATSVLLDWYGGTYTAPNLYLTLEPLDFTAKVFVSNIAADDSSGGGLVHYQQGDKSQYNRIQWIYNAGYKVHAVVEGDESVGAASVGQSSGWLAIVRRGYKLIYYYSTNGIDNEPTIDEMTEHRVFDQHFTYNKNLLALFIVAWNDPPVTDIHFNKFSLVYNKVNLYQNDSYFSEQHFETDGTEIPDSEKTFSLRKIPGGGGVADSLSGYHLWVFRNGQLLKYVGTLSDRFQYKYNPSTNEVTIWASGEEDDVDVYLIEAVVGAETASSSWVRENFLFSSATDAAAVDTSGRFTQGVKFRCRKACRIIGVRYYVGAEGYTGSLTNKLSLWRVIGSTQLKTKSVDAPTTEGYYEALFDTPFEVSGSDIFEQFMATIYWGEAKHWQANAPTLEQGPRVIGDVYKVDQRPHFYIGSDAFPTSVWGAGHYFVDPIIEYEKATVVAVTESYLGHEEDIPPTSPTIYDDEFNGEALATKWSWFLQGAPAETANDKHWLEGGRLHVITPENPTDTFPGDRALCQPIPSQNFEFSTKVYSSRYANYERAGLLLLDTTNTNGLMVGAGFHSGNGNSGALWVNRWTTGWADHVAGDFGSGMPQQFKMEYDVTTKVAKVYHSADGFNWKLLYTSEALTGWSIDYFGLSISAVWAGANNYSSFEWFRVTLL